MNGLGQMAIEQDERIARAVERDSSRLREFIRGRVPDVRDAEDILQDVFYRLVEANRMLMPIDHVTGWLFRVARNRITDFFRTRKPEVSIESGGENLGIADLLPSPSAGPDAIYERDVVLRELEEALAELPAEQRDVFIAHELDGRSFRELSDATGVGVNTLLSRKHYAVLHLRERLRDLYDELTKG